MEESISTAESDRNSKEIRRWIYLTNPFGTKNERLRLVSAYLTAIVEFLELSNCSFSTVLLNQNQNVVFVRQNVE